MKKLLLILLFPLALGAQNFKHESGGVTGIESYSEGTVETDTLRTRYIRLLDGLNSDSIASYIYFDGDTSHWVGDPIKIGNNSIVVKDDTVKISNAMLTVSGQVQADTLVPYHNSTIYVRHFTVDTIEIVKYIHQQEVAQFDSVAEWVGDGDALRIDASINGNVLEYEDENVTKAALDSAGNWSAQSLTASETLGAELITNFAGWTPTTNWTYADGKWSHATGNATALVSDWSPTVGVNYKVVYTIAQSVAGTGVTLAVGGVSFPASTAAGTYTYKCIAPATTELRFTPGSLWVGDITAVSVTVISGGDASFVDGTFSGQMLGPIGNASYPTYSWKDFPTAGFYFRILYDGSPELVLSTVGAEKIKMSGAGVTLKLNAQYYAFRDALSFIYSDANNQFDFRNSTKPNILNFYNTYTSATSYERGFARATATAIEFGSEKGSEGGTARPVNFYTDGVSRGSISATGITTFADTLRAPRITASGGLRIGVQASESITAVDTIKTPSGGAVRWVKLTVAGVDFLAFPAADSSSFRNP